MKRYTIKKLEGDITLKVQILPLYDYPNQKLNKMHNGRKI